MNMMKLMAMVVVVLPSAVGLAAGADLADLCRVDSRETFFFSSENPKGLRSGGNAKPNCKESASTFLPPGQTLVLADIDGPGRIESIWIGGRGERLVLRMGDAYDVCGRKGRFLEGEPHTVRTIVDGPVTDYFVGWGIVAGMTPTVANGRR